MSNCCLENYSYSNISNGCFIQMSKGTMGVSYNANFGLLHFGSSLDDEVPEPVSLGSRPTIFASLVAVSQTPWNLQI